MSSKVLSKLCAASAVFAAFSFATPIANADAKIVQSTVVINAQFAAEKQTMTPQQIAAIKSHGDGFLLGIAQITTTYTTPNYFRLDSGTQSAIVDAKAGTFTTVDRAKKVYETTPLANLPTQGGGYQVTVTPTGKHATILGQQTTLYNIRATNISLPGTLVTGEVWTASLAHPVLPAAGPMTAAAAILRQLHGIPLRLTLKITGSSEGDSTITLKTLSLSNASLPSTTFKPPKSYHPGILAEGSVPAAGVSGL